MPRLEEVFKIGGTPTYTFVAPKEYSRLIVSLRTAGRGIVVEGPSGIGKTSAVEKALKDIGLDHSVIRLSARKPKDLEFIDALPDLNDAGVIIVDDFHKLEDARKARLADYMKILADESRADTKLVVIGINKAGDSLVKFASDLNNRIDVIPFESNPREKIVELLEKGQKALNIELNVKDDVADSAHGSFYIAQMLAHEVCLKAGIMESASTVQISEVSFEAVKAEVWDRLDRVFGDRCKRFSQGTRYRPEGRAPYLHLLNWLAMGGEWTLSVQDAMRQYPSMRGSIGQIIDERNLLRNLIEGDNDISNVINFDAQMGVLSVEDPQFVFYIRNIAWGQFAREIGYHSVEFKNPYDFALSFAGSDRDVAKALFEKLREREVEVFYDKNEQHRLAGSDVEDYLRPIYQSEANFVIALLGPDYPKKIWTKFESEQFKERFKQGEVIPIWFDNAPPSLFDESTKKGGFMFQRSVDFDAQIEEIANLLSKKLRELRINQSRNR